MLMRSLMTGIVIFLLLGSITMIIWQGAVDVSAGRMSGGTIAAFVLYGGLLAGAFGALSEVYGDLLRAAGASERLNELLAAEPDIRPPAQTGGPPPRHAANCLRGCQFRYPTRKEISALEGFNLAVRPRERLSARRPVGRGKDDPLPARPALLRSASRRRADGRRRPHRRRPADIDRASPWCRRKRAVRRHRPRQSPLRQLGSPATTTCGGPHATPMPRNSSRPPGRPRHPWAKAACGCRAASASASPSPARSRDAPAAAARRGHQRARCGERAAGAGGARAADGRSHHDRHRPPPVDGPRRRPHRRARRREIVEEGKHDSLTKRGGLYARSAHCSSRIARPSASVLSAVAAAAHWQ